VEGMGNGYFIVRTAGGGGLEGGAWCGRNAMIFMLLLKKVADSYHCTVGLFCFRRSQNNTGIQIQKPF
jgi:hypothetical protein